MDESSEPRSLLNVFEVENDGTHRHFLCFLEPEIASAEGIDPKAVIGEFAPGEDGEFDPESFLLNPGFLDAFTGYMNEEAVTSPQMREEATRRSGDFLFVADPRWAWTDGKEPESNNLLGQFAVGDDGQIVPGSFIYNGLHQWFDRQSGLSGVFSDRRFYDWLLRKPDH